MRAFYAFFIVVMIASMGAIGFGASQGSPNPVPPENIDITPVPEVTPVTKTFPSPAPVIDGTEPYMATIVTNRGDIVVELSTDAPETVNSFAFLAAKNFYDNLAFFYVVKDYYAQVGDPACNPDLDVVCTGTGDAGYDVSLENTDAEQVQWSLIAPHVPGTESASGGQFAILYQDLGDEDTVFGTVVEGQDILNGLDEFRLCSALNKVVEGCAEEIADSPLIIEDVVVERG